MAQLVTTSGRFKIFSLGLRALMILSVVGLVSFTVSLVGCGNTAQSTDQRTDISDDDIPPPQRTPEEQQRWNQMHGAGSSANGGVAAPKAATDAKEATNVGESPAQDLIRKGFRDEAITAYTIPERLRAQLSASPEDQGGPIPHNKTSAFAVFNQHLKIDAKNAKVTFTGVLRIAGKADEVIELACAIQPSESPWVCTDMIATDAQIAVQDRMKATFKCLDTYRCNNTGLKLWIAINGQYQEPQVFQSRRLPVRPAATGDDEEDVTAAPGDAPPPPASPNTPAVTPAPPATPSAPVATATPASPAAQDLVEEGEDYSPDDIDQILKDPGTSLEVAEPMRLPEPTVARPARPVMNSSPRPVVVAEPPAARPAAVSSVRAQAIGWHDSGHLQNPVELSARASGFTSRDHGSKDFGTDRLVTLLTSALAQVDTAYPGRPPVTIGSLANRSGGQLYNLSGNKHFSHQTGLDADVGLPSRKGTAGLWPACATHSVSKTTRLAKGKMRTSTETVCVGGATISPDLDDERFWAFLKQTTCESTQPVIAMFLDAEIKAHMCRYAKAHEDISQPNSCAYQALRKLRPLGGHYNHVHVRIRCPGNEDCQNSDVTLGIGNGC